MPTAIFVDASAIVAIIAHEAERQALIVKLDAAERRLTSPLAVWEAANALERLRASGFEEAEHAVRNFLGAAAITTIDITAEIGDEALRAAKLYGKGRHPARLNFGDCFAYACAKVLDVPLLFKGDDFSKTDIQAA